MAAYQVGVIGATSYVGSCLLSGLRQAGHPVVAFSRNRVTSARDGVTWGQLATFPALDSQAETQPIGHWICTAPIWVLPEHFGMLESRGAKRIVAVSSTSRLTKQDSSDREERKVARRLAAAEDEVRGWAQDRGIDWVVLRPTLIYGLGRDKNVSDIARFIRRYGFFPLLGKAHGRRQPIHARDVADACISALQTPAVRNRAYDISGGETLPYREMITRIFNAMDRPPLILPIPLVAFRSGVAMLRLFPRYRHLSVAMAERMNHDLVFDHSDAMRDFSFRPGKFMLSAQDLPQ